MSFIGLIPARGGSKRIAGKNITACGDKPLIAHTIEAALASRYMERTILSTEDTTIAETARAWGVEVPFLRPAELANDGAPMIGVMQHALQWLEHDGSDVEALVLLQPTSPLRTAAHIDGAIDLFRQHPEAESVCSVVRPPHIFHPLKMLKPTAQGLVPFVDGMVPVVGHRDLPEAYARNGPAVLVVRSGVVKRGEVYGYPSLPFVMPPEASIDVDDQNDLDLADMALRRRECTE